MMGTEKRLRRAVNDYREGKVCEKCGSAFDLTVHHEGNPYMSHKEKMKREETALKGLAVLCRTCHYEVDFDHNMRFYERAALRRYNEKMDVEEKRWKVGKFAKKNSGRRYT